MSHNIEIEFKNILTKEEFTKLKHFFQINDACFINQKNHYFDTEDFALKNKGSALRIRQKGAKYELTLKQPHPEGLLETNELIGQTDAEQMLVNMKLTDGPILKLIKEMQINPEKIQYFGTLKTNRAEIEYKQGLIVLDHSDYLNTEDYEIEYEVSNRDKGLIIFQDLLKQAEIPIRNTENKIKRFFNEKFKQQN